MVEEHPLFKREGQDIILDVPISFMQAALGAEIEAPTLTGPAKLKVPPGTQPGHVFRLKGKGFPPSPRLGFRRPALQDSRRGPLKAYVQAAGIASGVRSSERRGCCSDHQGVFDKVKEVFGEKAKK